MHYQLRAFVSLFCLPATAITMDAAREMLARMHSLRTKLGHTNQPALADQVNHATHELVDCFVTHYNFGVTDFSPRPPDAL